ncbi:MAG: universal stress protein [Halobacteriaceae archaeon]
MYDEILVPVDGSDAASVAVAHAAALASAHGARLRLLYVADTARDSVTLVGTGVTDVLAEEGDRLLEKTAAELREEGHDVAVQLEQGDPSETIVAAASGAGSHPRPALIVMGSHGRSGLERHLLGSVTERVLRRTDVPVYVVSPDSSPPAAG